MLVESEPAIILHRRDYRDSSLLLDAFTRDHGRVGLIARGAKRPRGRWRGLLEPLRVMQIGWGGRGELKSLAQAEPIEPGIRLSGLPLYGGFYLAELMLRLTPRENAQPGLFGDLLSALKQLEGSDNIAPALRKFEYQLLDACGYGVPLDATEDGEEIKVSGCYSLNPDTGFSAVTQDFPASFSGAAILALRDEAFFDQQHAQEIRRLLSQALQSQLGVRPLQSAATLRSMQKLQRKRSAAGQVKPDNDKDRTT